MTLLFAIPHFCSRDSDTSGKYGSLMRGPNERGDAIAQCIVSLHQLFGRSQAMIEVGDRRTVAVNHSMRHEVRVLVVTHGRSHALRESNLPDNLYKQISVDVPPSELGNHCHLVLAEYGSDCDYCCYMEDDLIIRDSWWFEKLCWFNRHVDHRNLLMANRYEVSSNLAYRKCYLDGALAPHVVKPFQDVSVEPELRSKTLGKSIRFVRPLNPHSGCFFLNREQMRIWKTQSSFGSPNADFIGPLESAATRSIMQAFRLYKPAPENANFFEIEHYGNQFIQKIRKP